MKFNKFRLMYGLEFMRLWPAILTTGKAVEVLVLQPPYIAYSFALKPGPLNNVFETHIPVDHRISIFQTVGNDIFLIEKYSELKRFPVC